MYFLASIICTSMLCIVRKCWVMLKKDLHKLVLNFEHGKQGPISRFCSSTPESVRKANFHEFRYIQQVGWMKSNASYSLFLIMNKTSLCNQCTLDPLTVSFVYTHLIKSLTNKLTLHYQWWQGSGKLQMEVIWFIVPFMYKSQVKQKPTLRHVASSLVKCDKKHQMFYLNYYGWGIWERHVPEHSLHTFDTYIQNMLICWLPYTYVNLKQNEQWNHWVVHFWLPAFHEVFFFYILKILMSKYAYKT